MNQDAPGRLTRFGPHDIWASKAKDFALWLSREDNLSRS